jgi:TetR/AcrR family transcriptional regulator, transcriptional repressor for nem operon
VARPREFDREDALKAAMETFWTHGFEGAGMESLSAAMGIGRQSVYGAFGGKKALYLEALRAYNAGNVGALVSALRKAKSPMEGLKIVLLTPIELTGPERAKGCFGINAICEFGQSDDDVTAALSVSGRILHIALVDLVREAQTKGEIGPGVDPVVAAGLIQILLSGVKVAARAGTAPEAMRRVIDLALGALKA